MFLLYNVALALTIIVGAPVWIYKGLRHAKYRVGLRERLGHVPARILGFPSQPLIWIHAVSVGEVLAISRLVAELKLRLPGHRIVVSTTTVTGQTLARERFGTENVFFFPLDLGFCIRPYLRALRPQVVVMAETEFWPNFLRQAKQCGARIAVVNARISDRSLPGYTRWRGMLGRVLAQVDLFLAQSDEDQRRLIAIGASSSRVHVSGNLKFDVKPPQESPIVDRLSAAIERGGGGPVIVAGSTTDGEEAFLVSAFQSLLPKFPKAVLLLAPRRPERFDAVWDELSTRGTDSAELRAFRRSQCDCDTLALSRSILLLDTIGELAALYELADVAIVGGSFAPHGGHNILEPALFGKAIVVGPHTENFRDIIAIFQRADAVRVATACRAGESQGNLGDILAELLNNDDARRRLGANAEAVMESQRGASSRTADALAQLLRGRA